MGGAAAYEVALSHFYTDTSPDTYSVLLKFRDPYSANSYYKQYNDRLFSSMEPEKCQVVYVESIEFNADTISPSTIPFTQQVDLEQDDLLSACPVCLEPMDEKSSGLLTILCQHTFHCHCLSKWGDGSCPVCRYSQKPHRSIETESAQTADQTLPMRDSNDENECATCHATEHLWVCLICGNVGCGRYENAHAYEHYRQTDHLYSLEIETQRVWDYAGDGYVHRLIQNAVDGKLVELPSTTEDSNVSASQEKLEAISLEYNYLLTSQLDSQQLYYESQMDQVAAQLSDMRSKTRSLLAEADQIQAENKRLEAENLEKEKQIVEFTKGKEKADKKLESWKEKCETTKAVWLEEKEMTNSLLENNSLLLKCMEDREKAIKELSDQVRDLMFFLEAREKVQGHPELEGGSVETRTPQPRSKRGKGKRS
ncbi:zf-UBP-domain-containing protein [Mucor ambiguus]|uniref:Zf-UBP-domain-containing protein n=1 Tax=Mucor ambiguus TaxID=91626 RepID=A0A0C9LX18_9FUNG|nr:zf-UBP-domain-containing protein [Mucor ambiguus]